MTAPQTRRGSWATIKSVCLFTLTTWFCLERANAAETPFASAAQRNLQASDGQAAAADALLASTTLQPPKQMNLPVVLADWAGDKPSPKGTQPQPTPLSAAAIKPQTASKPGPAAAAPQKSTSSAAAAMQLPRRSGSGLKRQLLLNMHHHPHGAHHNATAHRHHNKTKADANPATASSRRLVELARRHNSTKGAHTKFATTPSSGRRQLDSSGGSTDMASGRCVCTFDFDLTLRVERDGREDMPAWDAAGIIADCKSNGYGIAIASANGDESKIKPVLRDKIDGNTFNDAFFNSAAFQIGESYKTYELQRIARYYNTQTPCIMFFDDAWFNKRYAVETGAVWEQANPKTGVSWDNYKKGKEKLYKQCTCQ